MESGRYVSWFSSTFRAVNFFSEPEITGEDAERERENQRGRQGPRELLIIIHRSNAERNIHYGC